VIDYDLRNSGFINYDALSNIERELREQYAIQETEGIRYKRPEDLDTIFRTQAAKLAAQGVESVYDLTPAPYEFQGDDRGTVTNLLNKRTGDVLREARLREGWEEDPTAVAFKKTKNLEGKTVNQPIELQSREEGFDRWGYDTSVEGMAHYGINFVDGVPVFTPYYKDTSSEIFGVNLEDAVKTAIAVAGIYYGGSALLGSGAGTAGAGATAGTAGAGAAGAGAASTGAAAGTGLTAGAGGATGLTAGAAGVTGLTAPAGFTLAPTLGTSLAAGGAGLGLLDGAQFPVEGLQATSSTVPSTAASFGTTTAAEGLAIPTTPGLSAMGGAQGLTVPVAGGTISQLGLVPTGAVPALGPDGFFSTSLVNDPNVLGNAVFSTDSLLLPAAASSGMSLSNALQAGNLANTIFNPPKLPQQGLLGGRQQSQFSLPQAQPTVIGLLPLAERYRRSLI
jgi:hypothetical protein